MQPQSTDDYTCGDDGFACIDPAAVCVDDDDVTVVLVESCNYIPDIGEARVDSLLRQS